MFIHTHTLYPQKKYMQKTEFYIKHTTVVETIES